MRKNKCDIEIATANCYIYFVSEKNTDQRYSIGAIAEKTGISRRTVRYYVQLGLIEPPVGKGRGSYYIENTEFTDNGLIVELGGMVRMFDHLLLSASAVYNLTYIKWTAGIGMSF